MNINHTQKLQDYLKDIEELSSVDIHITKEPVLQSHARNVTKSLKECLHTRDIKTEKKIKREPSVLPYETLDPLLSAYDTALEQRDQMLDQANQDIDRLSNLVECLAKENKTILTEIIKTKKDYSHFATQQGTLIRELLPTVEI